MVCNIVTAAYGMYGLGSTYQSSISSINQAGNTKVPTITFDSKKTPAVAENIRSAQRNGAPSRLTRVVDRDVINSNRRTALRGIRSAGPGLSLDEYPFASSYQGGHNSQVMIVPQYENSVQGGMLSRFYLKYNIEDGDKYIVNVN